MAEQKVTWDLVTEYHRDAASGDEVFYSKVSVSDLEWLGFDLSDKAKEKMARGERLLFSQMSDIGRITIFEVIE